MNNEQRVLLWNAVNEYARTCGGHTGNRPKAGPIISVERQHAVVLVEQAVEHIVSALAAPPAGPREQPQMTRADGWVQTIPWPGPTLEMFNDDPTFEAVWQAIKRWDINVPGAYSGYMGATGNHVRAILDAIHEPPAAPPAGVGAEPDFPPPTPEQLNAAVAFIVGQPGDDQTRMCTCNAYPHLPSCGETCRECGNEPMHGTEVVGGLCDVCAPAGTGGRR